MALAAFHRKKLQAVRDSITRDKRAVVEARAEGEAAGRDAGYFEAATEIAALRVANGKLAAALDEQMIACRNWQEKAVAVRSLLASAELREAGLRADVAALTAEGHLLKDEASILRRESANPRKAAIHECIAVVTAERTVSRAVTALRALLKG